VKSLLKKSPELVNARNKYGETPLHWAAYRGKTRIAKLLIKKNADINARDTIGDMPLSIAIKRGHKAIVRALRKV